MADRYDNEPERNRDWERERDRERERGEHWRSENYDRDRERGWGNQNRDWELGRSSDWDRGNEGRRYEGRQDWSRSVPRGGNPGPEGGEIGRGEQWGRNREFQGGGSRYEANRQYGQFDRYGTQGQWAGGMSSARGDQAGFRNEMGGIGQGGSQGGYRNDQRGYTGLGSEGWGNYSGGMGQYYGRHAGRGPKGYQRSDDRIREDINEHLTQHPDIDATEIDVNVQNGEVTLTGTVDHRHTKRLAEDVAENVSGVREVHNQIRVQHGVHAGYDNREDYREGRGGRENRDRDRDVNVGVAGGTANANLGAQGGSFSSHMITPDPVPQEKGPGTNKK